VTRTRRQRPRRRENISSARETGGLSMVGRGSSPRHAVVARVVRTDPSAHAFPAALQPAPHTRAVAAIHVAELDLLIARKSNLRLIVGQGRALQQKQPTYVRFGSFSTDPAGLAWRLMSALAQKRF
jgi:hypothetical protein